MVTRNVVGAFVALTFAISWAIWFAMIAGSVSITTTTGLILNIVATAGPSIGALILAVVLGGGAIQQLLRGFSRTLVSPLWALVALLLPVGMVAIAIAASVGLLGAAAPAITVAVAGGLVVEFVRVLFLGGPLEEELGWRGFLLPRLQAGRTAFNASVLLGVIWGVWHVPLYFVLGTGQHETAAAAGAAFAIIAFVVWTIALSILFTWLFNQTQGSLIVVILFHASVNLAAFAPAAIGSAGAASFLYPLVTWIVALIVAARYGRENLASRPRVRISSPRSVAGAE